MQEQAFQADLLTKPLVDVRIAVFVVTGHRMTQMLGMHADLVGPAGFDPHFAVRMAALALEHLEVADRLLADRIDLHVALATLAQAHVQRGVHGHGAIGHAAGQQRQVALADAGAVVFTQQRLQLAQGRALLGHDQQAGGIPVQAMD